MRYCVTSRLPTHTPEYQQESFTHYSLLSDLLTFEKLEKDLNLDVVEVAELSRQNELFIFIFKRFLALIYLGFYFLHFK
jgi:hypothetical protein